MATDKATAERLASYLAPAGPIRIRAMMGGYLVYLDDVYIALITGSDLYLKRTPAGDRLAQGVELASPYEGAKPAYKLSPADLERTDWLTELARATRDALKGK